MNYELILKELKPSQEERDAIYETTKKVIDFINETCEKEGINAKANAVGSVAKNTWLKGNSDIDIFISFPYDDEMEYLKEKGLYLAYKTNEALDGKASEHYASHPYLTCDIDGYIELFCIPITLRVICQKSRKMKSYCSRNSWQPLEPMVQNSKQAVLQVIYVNCLF